MDVAIRGDVFFPFPPFLGLAIFPILGVEDSLFTSALNLLVPPSQLAGLFLAPFPFFSFRFPSLEDVEMMDRVGEAVVAVLLELRLLFGEMILFGFFFFKDSSWALIICSFDVISPLLSDLLTALN